MDTEFIVKIDKAKMDGLDFIKNTIDKMKEIRTQVPPEMKVHCKNTLDRMCELAESLEIGWRKWVVDEFNRHLHENPLLQKMTCCEQADFRSHYHEYDD